MECEFPTVNSNKQEIKEIFDITTPWATFLIHLFSGYCKSIRAVLKKQHPEKQVSYEKKLHMALK